MFGEKEIRRGIHIQDRGEFQKPTGLVLWESGGAPASPKRGEVIADLMRQKERALRELEERYRVPDDRLPQKGLMKMFLREKCELERLWDARIRGASNPGDHEPEPVERTYIDEF